MNDTTSEDMAGAAPRTDNRPYPVLLFKVTYMMEEVKSTSIILVCPSCEAAHYGQHSSIRCNDTFSICTVLCETEDDTTNVNIIQCEYGTRVYATFDPQDDEYSADISAAEIMHQLDYDTYKRMYNNALSMVPKIAADATFTAHLIPNLFILRTVSHARDIPRWGGFFDRHEIFEWGERTSAKANPCYSFAIDDAVTNRSKYQFEYKEGGGIKYGFVCIRS